MALSLSEQVAAEDAVFQPTAGADAHPDSAQPVAPMRAAEAAPPAQPVAPAALAPAVVAAAPPNSAPVNGGSSGQGALDEDAQLAMALALSMQSAEEPAESLEVQQQAQLQALEQAQRAQMEARAVAMGGEAWDSSDGRAAMDGDGSFGVQVSID